MANIRLPFAGIGQDLVPGNQNQNTNQSNSHQSVWKPAE